MSDLMVPNPCGFAPGERWRVVAIRDGAPGMEAHDPECAYCAPGYVRLHEETTRRRRVGELSPAERFGDPED